MRMWARMVLTGNAARTSGSEGRSPTPRRSTAGRRDRTPTPGARRRRAAGTLSPKYPTASAGLRGGRWPAGRRAHSISTTVTSPPSSNRAATVERSALTRRTFSPPHTTKRPSPSGFDARGSVPLLLTEHRGSAKRLPVAVSYEWSTPSRPTITTNFSSALNAKSSGARLDVSMRTFLPLPASWSVIPARGPATPTRRPPGLRWMVAPLSTEIDRRILCPFTSTSVNLPGEAKPQRSAEATQCRRVVAFGTSAMYAGYTFPDPPATCCTLQMERNPAWTRARYPPSLLITTRSSVGAFPGSSSKKMSVPAASMNVAFDAEVFQGRTFGARRDHFSTVKLPSFVLPYQRTAWPSRENRIDSTGNEGRCRTSPRGIVSSVPRSRFTTASRFASRRGGIVSSSKSARVDGSTFRGSSCSTRASSSSDLAALRVWYCQMANTAASNARRTSAIFMGRANEKWDGDGRPEERRGQVAQ